MSASERKPVTLEMSRSGFFSPDFSVKLNGTPVTDVRRVDLSVPPCGDAPTARIDVLALDGFDVRYPAHVTVQIFSLDGGTVVEEPQPDGTRRFRVIANTHRMVCESCVAEGVRRALAARGETE